MSMVVIPMLTSWIVVDGWFTLVFKIAVTGIICSLIFMLAYCRTEGFQVILKKVISVVKK